MIACRMFACYPKKNALSVFTASDGELTGRNTTRVVYDTWLTVGALYSHLADGLLRTQKNYAALK